MYYVWIFFKDDYLWTHVDLLFFPTLFQPIPLPPLHSWASSRGEAGGDRIRGSQLDWKPGTLYWKPENLQWKGLERIYTWMMVCLKKTELFYIDFQDEGLHQYFLGVGDTKGDRIFWKMMSDVAGSDQAGDGLGEFGESFLIGCFTITSTKGRKHWGHLSGGFGGSPKWTFTFTKMASVSPWVPCVYLKWRGVLLGRYHMVSLDSVLHIQHLGWWFCHDW